MTAEQRFGTWLRSRRRALDFTQSDLADTVGCSPETIRKFEAERQRPSREMANRLAEKLQIAAADRPVFARLARSVLRDQVEDATSAGVPPTPTTPILGREGDIAAIETLLRRKSLRLLSLVGPGGAGKTRLALEIANRSINHFPDGVTFVPLATIQDSDLLWPTLAAALGLREQGRQGVFEAIVAYLRSRRALLVLDNFEQLLAAAPLVSDLLGACPTLTILTTSRAALRIRGEQEYPVAPLALPEPGTPEDLTRLSQFAAVALFVERALSVAPDFQLHAGNAAAVAEICIRLDGLPLAIELAAARTRILSPQEILARVSGTALTLLRDGPRDLPQRQQSLRAVLDWSYQLLAPADQHLFACLSLFAGGCTLAGAEAILGADRLPGLDTLVSQNLLIRTARGQHTRYQMLETIREYALEQLALRPELPELRQRQLAWVLALVHRGAELLRTPAEAGWFEALDAEQANIRSLIEWGTRQESAFAAVARIVVGLVPFWIARGYLREGRRWCERVRTSATLAVGVRLELEHAAGLFAMQQGEYGVAEQHLLAGLDLARQSANVASEAHCLFGLGRLVHNVGNFEQALAYVDAAERLYTMLGETLGLADLLMLRGNIANGQGYYPLAERYLSEGLIIAREAGDEILSASLTSSLGTCFFAYGDLERAYVYNAEALDTLRRRGRQHGVAVLLLNQGNCLRDLGQFEQALSMFEESAVLRHNAGDVRGEGIIFNALAELRRAQGNLEGALSAFARAIGIFRTVGARSWEAVSLTYCGIAFASLQRAEEAQVHLEAAQAIQFELHSSDMLPDIWLGLALLAVQAGDPLAAIAWCARCDVLLKRSNARFARCNGDIFAAVLTTTQTNVSPAQFAKTWAAAQVEQSDAHS